MQWQTFYEKPSIKDWQGKTNSPPASCFFQKIKLITTIEDFPLLPDLSFVFLGFQSEEGIKRNLGRPGASEGPHMIRQMLSRLPFPRMDAHCYDVGNIKCLNGQLEVAQEILAKIVGIILKANGIPILLGGGHEIAWGHYLGIRKAKPNTDLSILNVDAHFDMRELSQGQGTSGSAFLQMAKLEKEKNLNFFYYCLGIQAQSNVSQIFETANQYHVHYIEAENFYLYPDKIAAFIQAFLLLPNPIYVSLCLDVFGEAYAPGVSAPNPLGITPWQMIPILRQIVSSTKVISYDIAELSPPLDSDHKTARLAAALIYEIVKYHQKNLKD